ncbi:hypothetical protein ACFQ1F_08545 [Flaviramulus multivorans]|uniref:hypothetical protein n=1 Tax=Flaviramulus multivorans TaxID=1304750 RepID=UPI00363B3FB2
MKNPLTKQQEKLRGKKIVDLTDAELLLWINACDKMENWVGGNKARRSWTSSRQDAVDEIEKRDINKTPHNKT